MSHGMKTQFWDPGGAYFSLKLIIVEVFELVVQLNSLFNSSVDSDAAAVLVSSIVLGCNMIVLPVVVLLGCFGISVAGLR